MDLVQVNLPLLFTVFAFNALSWCGRDGGSGDGGARDGDGGGREGVVVVNGVVMGSFPRRPRWGKL